MDNFLNRLNVIFYSMALCFLVLCVFNYGTSFYLFDEKEMVTNIQVKSVKRIVYNRYIKGDEVVLSLDLSYDMRKAFNWNLKQLFLYVLVTYQTPEKVKNEVIIQDYIIKNKKTAKKNFKNFITKYSLKDYYNGLRNNLIILQVCYKYMPIVGFARSYEGAKISYRLPAEYFDSLPSNYPLYYPDK
ncbi:signal peptidase complex subunit 3 [Plasmodium brasilianum]|uniref:Signal peptidase complex subunit 3 n=2 Tax=Plasmodium (Plasmodium) TaxID=418103 RepID=A0A1A8WWH0_PLAMA|nr:signal peptidase complex subunit 3, putative [Plasmodium malariae]KAI4839286.1 signal peptidase complex subunit 3 [Plasmodium brasilianum]SBS96702.1 signal peptidase complex subunit 3, putative (SPC3) [Plasmodium malariae]SBT87698.1 signal peptidase complex subunit 3, putative [Plasmodium malariae]